MAIAVVRKVWGFEDWLVNNDLYCAKRLRIRGGWECSDHLHNVKDETFVVETGLVYLMVGGIVRVIGPGDPPTRIPPKTRHLFGARSPAVMLEVSTHHSDLDVIRFSQSGPFDEDYWNAHIEKAIAGIES